MTATLTRPEPDTTLDYPDTLLIGDHPDIDHLDDGDVPEAFYTTNAPGNHIGKAGTYTRKTSWFLYRAILRLPSSSGHPICADLVSVGEDVHCESTAQEIHAGVPA